MKKKILALGAMAVVLLMLLMTCMPTVNAQITKETIEEKLKATQTNNLKNILVNSDLVDWLIDFFAAFFIFPVNFVVLFCTPIGWIMFLAMRILQGQDVVDSFIENFFLTWKRAFKDVMDGIG